MTGIALEGDEIRPTIQLTSEQIAELEAEKAALRGSVLAGRKSDAGHIKGEGSALDPEPNVISIRSRLAAQRAAAGEPEPVASDDTGAGPPYTVGVAGPRSKITADPQELADLIRAAKETQTESELADSMAEAAGAAAWKAREALDEYLREHGLA